MKHVDMKIGATTSEISEWFYQILSHFDVADKWKEFVHLLLMLIVATIIVYGVQFLTRSLVKLILKKTADSSKMPFLHELSQSKFAKYSAYFVPYLVIKSILPIVLTDFPKAINVCDKLMEIGFVYIIISSLVAFFSAVFEYLQKKPAYENKPMHSYLQVVKIILYLIAAVVIFSELTGKSPTTFFAAMGAASAVLMLMFRDTIIGFVASIQVTTNDIVRLNDWITMPKYGADGDVIEINLTTVKIQNFDMTISTIPTYALISDSFQNWRPMQEFGGRRIKRSISIKQESIHFLEKKELENFKKIQSLSLYIEKKQAELDAYNQKINADISLRINGRSLTNIGLFRKYVEQYLLQHPQINKNTTLLVRQLSPSEKGLPIEIYAFTNTTKWKEYEEIMSDIFDHLIASVEFFDLIIFENKSSTDVIRVKDNLIAD